MTKQLKWVDNGTELILWVSTDKDWIPYTHHASRQPEPPILGSDLKPSKGFSTAQYLLKQGYTYKQD